MKVRDVMTTSVDTIEPTGRAVYQGFDGAIGSVRNGGSSDVYCFEDQDVQEAAMLMQKHQIRQAVVLNRGKKIVGIVSLNDVSVETDDEKMAVEMPERLSEPSPTTTAPRPTPPTRSAAHAQPVDPEGQAVQGAGLAKPQHDAQLQAAEKDQPVDAQHRMQEVLPEVKAVAQKVGGFKHLSAIAKTWEQHTQTQATAKNQPGDSRYRLEEVLPEIKAVAQKVGGFKQLAEIAKTLEQSRE